MYENEIRLVTGVLLVMLPWLSFSPLATVPLPHASFSPHIGTGLNTKCVFPFQCDDYMTLLAHVTTDSRRPMVQLRISLLGRGVWCTTLRGWCGSNLTESWRWQEAFSLLSVTCYQILCFVFMSSFCFDFDVQGYDIPSSLVELGTHRIPSNEHLAEILYSNIGIKIRNKLMLWIRGWYYTSTWVNNMGIYSES